MRLDELKHGRTAVLGYGREARALEAVLRKTTPQAKIEFITEQPNDTAPSTWPLRVASLQTCVLEHDRIIRSPGIPVDVPALVRARAQGIPITTSSSLWFAERPDACTIAITGSKGKSTTSALLAHLLGGVDQTVELVGNIGVPLISRLQTRADWFVIELSSYQLVDLVAQPSLGVMTRLFPEHVDWHGSLARYYSAKRRLQYLLDGHPLWINDQDELLSTSLDPLDSLHRANTRNGIHRCGDAIFAGSDRLLAEHDWTLPGRHNLDNLALALSVVVGLGYDLESAVVAARSFEPLAHRLELFRDRVGRRWINDAISTSPHATQAALDSCAEDLVLIVGGQRRPTDWQPLIEHHRAQGRPPLTGVIGLPDTGSEIVRELIEGGLVDADQTRQVETMVQAVKAAHQLAGADSVILLSPGAPSFPHFENFEDRGRQFRRAVRERI
ncbi:MAG: UDP-N-acetylmuramoyl-L-alanine--D-glutamate ligase [Pseudomonadota bacterium]